jgi:4-amino-4-deoxy-L-arabinose transferase-like glycosyltransferase
VSTSIDTRPVWRAAAESFLPPAKRSGADRYLRHIPITLILLVQAVAALRLSNTAFQDEALYLYTGDWLMDSWADPNMEVYSHPEKFFSGAPMLYPVLAALLDELGGLSLVRLFSTVCMLSATLAVYWAANVLFEHHPRPRMAGMFSAFIFAVSAPVIFLSNFATFDAPSFTLIAWAVAVSIWSSKRNRSVLWGVAIGALCSLAVMLKYSSAIDVPVVLLLTLVVGWAVRSTRARAVARGIVAGLTTLVVLIGSVLTWASELLVGLQMTTTDRAGMVNATPAWTLLSQVAGWAGITFALMIAGGIYLLRRQPILAVLLLAGTVMAPSYQILMGEAVSLHKHLVLGMIFGAPLAGVMLSGMVRAARRASILLIVGICYGALMSGLIQSEKLFSVWADTTPLHKTVEFAVDSMPWIRALAEVPEPLSYSLADKSDPWQWTATYEGSFVYDDPDETGPEVLQGLEAYQHALEDNYFQIVVLDGSTDIGRQLEPVRYGFTQTDTVTAPASGHIWRVFQRFDNIPE